jgi:hypothetical protein
MTEILEAVQMAIAAEIGTAEGQGITGAGEVLTHLQCLYNNAEENFVVSCIRLTH